jgi:hypothetical protein
VRRSPISENSHLDATSLSVEGQYKREYPTVEILKTGLLGEEIETGSQPIKITYGYSRDRRPDLKQFMIDLILFFADSVFLKSPHRIEVMALDISVLSRNSFPHNSRKPKN